MENEKRLKTCGDCIHADICKQLNGGWFSRENIAYCKAFKDKAAYVEVMHSQWTNIICFDGKCIGFCGWCGTGQESTNPTALKDSFRYCPHCGTKLDL